MHVFITIFLALTIWAPFVVGRMTIAVSPYFHGRANLILTGRYFQLNAAYYCFVGPVKVVRTVTDRSPFPIFLELLIIS